TLSRNVAPLLLHCVKMAVPLHICQTTIQCHRPKDEVTLVTDIEVKTVIPPTIDQWIRDCCHLLMADQVDRTISIHIIVRRCKHTAILKVGPGIGNGGIEKWRRTVIEGTMIATVPIRGKSTG